VTLCIVVATPFECEHIVTHMENCTEHSPYRKDGFLFGTPVSCIVTGIGMVNTAYVLAKELRNESFDRIINIGIGGSFDRSLPLGSVVEIIEDNYSEMGAEEGGVFLGLELIGFPSCVVDGKKYYNTFLNPTPSNADLPKVTAITVNKCHGNASSIEAVWNEWQKTIETMESAAFFQVTTMEKISFWSFRGISNYVEHRNSNNWRVREAELKIIFFLLQFLKNAIRGQALRAHS